MAIRQVVTMQAARGRGAQLLQDATRRSADILAERGCLQWEVFQSAVDPDKLVVMELWGTMESFRAHFDATVIREPGQEIKELRTPAPMLREDYEHNVVQVYWPHPEPGPSAG